MKDSRGEGAEEGLLRRDVRRPAGGAGRSRSQPGARWAEDVPLAPVTNLVGGLRVCWPGAASQWPPADFTAAPTRLDPGTCTPRECPGVP